MTPCLEHQQQSGTCLFSHYGIKMQQSRMAKPHFFVLLYCQGRWFGWLHQLPDHHTMKLFLLFGKIFLVYLSSLRLDSLSFDLKRGKLVNPTVFSICPTPNGHWNSYLIAYLFQRHISDTCWKFCNPKYNTGLWDQHSINLRYTLMALISTPTILIGALISPFIGIHIIQISQGFIQSSTAD